MRSNVPAESKGLLTRIVLAASKWTAPGGLPLSFAYVLAVVLPVGVLLVRLEIGFTPGQPPALVVQMIPIILCAYLGGLGPGLLATGVAALISGYFLMAPLHTLSVGKLLDRVLWSALVTAGILISVLTEALHRARKRASEREEVYSAIVNQAADAIVLLDAETLRFVEFNDAARNGLEYQRDEFAELRLTDLVETVDAANMIERLAEVDRAGKGNFETQFRSKQGELRDVWVSLQPITIRGRRYFASVCRDVTERNIAEEALRTSERELRMLFAAMTDVVLVLDGDGRYLKIAPTDPSNLYRPPEDCLGRTVHEILPKEDAGKILQKIRTVLETQRTISYEYKLDIGSREVWFDGRISPLTENTVFWIARDISERKEAEKAVRDSEERYRSIVDLSPIGIFVNVDGKFAYANASFARIMGFADSDEMLGKTVLDYFHPSFHDIIRERIRITMERGIPVPRLEEKLARPDGTLVDVEVAAAPISYQGSRGILVLVHDITAQLRAAEAQRLLATAVEQVAEAIIVTDSRGIIQYVNPAFERVSGYTKDEVLGWSPRILKSGAHTEAFYREMRDTIRGGRTWRARLTNKRKDGALTHEESTISPVKDAAGRIVNYVCVNRDVTAEERLHERLAQSQKMEAIGTLAGGIAHDFNNIIHAITGYTELVLEDLPESAPVRPDLERVLSAAQRAGDMVKQILTFSRQTRPERKPLYIGSVIKEGLKFLRAAIPTTIDIRWSIDPDLGKIHADPTQIHQVLMNLCTNAAHAMRETKGVLRVELTEMTIDARFAEIHPPLLPGKHVKMTVADTGHGIPPALMDRIFEPYFTTKEAGEGTGLGLSVVHGIVESHGGAITVYSEVDKGTTFNVYLPMAEEEADREMQADVEVPPTGTERILFVDDEPMLVEMGQTVLERLGYTVVSKTSPVEALELLKNDPSQFDLVITDLTMPVMTGVELAEQMTATRPSVPIILYTGFPRELSDSELNQAGIRAVIQKPMLKRAIAKLIRSVLDKK